MIRLARSNRVGVAFPEAVTPMTPETAGRTLGTGSLVLEAPTTPFAADDATAGCELELQAAVIGDRRDVDLPRTIEASTYYANLLKRMNSQETPRRALRDVQRFLEENPDRVWENSWVRFPRRVLSAFAQEVFEHDLLADKKNPARGGRADRTRFELGQGQDALLRLPVSYLIKLALADVVGAQAGLCAEAASTGRRLMHHYLNDHNSPETFSFYVSPLSRETGYGREVSREVGLRYLMTQLLTAYANDRFGLRESGQRAVVCCSPSPAVRQRALNDCVPDGFYRELYTSPCLAGWDQGEKKHDYMRLCHEVLSRAQLHAVAKMKEAGLFVTNLVILPNVSNTSLANNGVHISLGSRSLGRAMASGAMDATQEKRQGDLAIKLIEHFLPLFPGSYSAAPHRFDYADFHPERVLSFLPHELDYTHLRMFWRRWRKKARAKIFGQPLTPTGLEPLDQAMSRIFRLRGDYAPDFRLIDYMVAPLSTESSPALDGTLGNSERLIRDLAEHGIFDPRMPLYMLYRMRTFARMGYCGFEGRYYSLFERLGTDLTHAVNLQLLITAMAYRAAARGDVAHADIPDDPTTESERRQVFFGAAVGIPTFFVRHDTRNRYLTRLLAHANRTRPSRRYPGYVRVYNLEYRRALIRALERDAGDLIESMGLRETMDDLKARVEDPERHAAAPRLTRAILHRLRADSPLDVSAHTFNREAERYYRDDLRLRHIEESFDVVEDHVQQHPALWASFAQRLGPHGPGPSGDPLTYVRRLRPLVLRDEAPLQDLRVLINLLLLVLHHEGAAAEARLKADA